MKRLLFIIFIVFTSACSSVGVEPWDRDLLAQKKMQLDAEPLDDFLDQHIYFSKEASYGGSDVGGGGCGCN